MFEKVVAVNGSLHSEKGVRRQPNFLFASRVTSAPLGWSEIKAACVEMPIVFTGDGQLVPVAQLGAIPNKSAFVSNSGRWLGKYVPLHIRRFPFVLGETGSKSVYKVMVAEDELVNVGERETVLFDSTGGESRFLIAARNFLISYQADISHASEISAPLRMHDVLVNRELEFHTDGNLVGRVTNVQIVDTDRLKRLPDAVLADWARTGLLELVSLHILSLRNGLPKVD